VSHDLRAPLRAIDGFTRVLLKDHAEALNPKGLHYLERVRAGSRQMSQLIDDLLAFSRLSRQPLNRQTVDPAALVRQILNELRVDQAEAPVEITLADLPACEADAALLKQVFVNLLSNALKYSARRPTAVIEVGCKNESGQVVYFVKDNGVGFDMQFADKLFVVFQRLHSAEDYEGTGVGLAIAHHVIARHGGHIWAEAAVDQGATFFFTLPDGATAT
jgi:light-regulated signal transduction histidine kinase (bacteriophytochrome)